MKSLFNYSGFIEPANIKEYSQNRDKYAKVKAAGLASAAKCMDDYILDPIVSKTDRSIRFYQLISIQLKHKTLFSFIFRNLEPMHALKK